MITKNGCFLKKSVIPERITRYCSRFITRLLYPITAPEFRRKLFVIALMQDTVDPVTVCRLRRSKDFKRCSCRVTITLYAQTQRFTAEVGDYFSNDV